MRGPRGRVGRWWWVRGQLHRVNHQITRRHHWDTPCKSTIHGLPPQRLTFPIDIVFPKSLRFLNIALLAGFVTSGQEKNHLLSLSGKVNPIPRFKMESQFGNALSHGFIIPEITCLDSHEAGIDSLLGFNRQIIEPLNKRLFT